MSTDLKELEKRMGSAMDALKKEFTGLRTGRASVNLLDPVQVEAYGQRMPPLFPGGNDLQPPKDGPSYGYVSWGPADANAIAYAICVPLLARYRHAKMPPIRRRWYDIPLRASLVATLVATVVTTSSWVGPKVSGMIALFPIVFTSMMLILHPRIGGPPTAAVLANSAWGLIGLGIAIAVLHVAALQFGSAIGLSLALATCIGWNLGLWWIGRRKAVR